LKTGTAERGAGICVKEGRVVEKGGEEERTRGMIHVYSVKTKEKN